MEMVKKKGLNEVFKSYSCGLPLGYYLTFPGSLAYKIYKYPTD